MYESSSSRFGGSIMTLIKDYLIFCLVMMVLVFGFFGYLLYKAPPKSTMSNSIKWGNGMRFIK